VQNYELEQNVLRTWLFRKLNFNVLREQRHSNYELPVISLHSTPQRTTKMRVKMTNENLYRVLLSSPLKQSRKLWSEGPSDMCWVPHTPYFIIYPRRQSKVYSQSSTSIFQASHYNRQQCICYYLNKHLSKEVTINLCTSFNSLCPLDTYNDINKQHLLNSGKSRNGAMCIMCS